MSDLLAVISFPGALVIYPHNGPSSSIARAIPPGEIRFVEMRRAFYFLIKKNQKGNLPIEAGKVSENKCHEGEDPKLLKYGANITNSYFVIRLFDPSV